MSRSTWKRREFLRVAGAASLIGSASVAVEAEAPPETSTLRLAQIAGNCYAPQYVAESLLAAEGFSDLRYVRVAGSGQLYPALAAGEIDLTLAFLAPSIVQIDADASIVMLAGGHPGCLELFGSERIREIRDLKGKAVAVQALGSAGHVFIASMLAHVGIDAQRDVRWMVLRNEESLRLLAEGRVDAFMSGPPSSYEFRARKVGHVVVNMTTDRPWSQYFCCMLMGNREFVARHPVATKRALRAILKGADLCAGSPEPSARVLASRGFTSSVEAGRQLLREIPYAHWRDFNAEDSVRFYALRLQEAGFIKSSPKKIIAQGCDWRFLEQLKKELKT